MPSDSMNKLRKEINDIKLGEVLSPVEASLLEICDRLARKVIALERELKQLDRATESARAQSARF